MSLLEGKNFSVSDSGKVLELFGLRAMDGDRLGIWIMDFALTEGIPPILGIIDKSVGEKCTSD